MNLCLKKLPNNLFVGLKYSDCSRLFLDNLIDELP